MKKLLIICLLVVLAGCSAESDGTQAGVGDGVGGSLARFALVGDYLYTVDDQSLRIFDIKDPRIPTFAGEKYIGFDIETLYSLGNYLFVGSRLGMYIYDITDPKFPLQLSAVQHVRSCDPVVSSGDYTYVTLHSNSSCPGDVNRLEIYDTRDLLRPALVTTINLDRPIGLGLYSNYLFVTDQNEVRIFDVTDPSQPDLVGGIEEDAFDLIIIENRIFIIGNESLSQYKLDPDDITNISLTSELTF